MSSPTPPSPSTPSSSSSHSLPPRTPPNLHQNSIDPAAPWLVQKFGGTSVGKFPVKIARDVVSNYLDNTKLAIVCSARSGSTKALGTTSLLLKAASQALERPKSSSSFSSPSSPRPPSSSAGTGANTPIHSNPRSTGLFGGRRSYSGHASSDEGSGSPTSPRSRSSSSSKKPGLFGFTPLSSANGTTTPNGFGGSAKKDLPEFHATVDLIKEEHLKAAREHVGDEGIREELEEEIERDCEWLRSFLYAAKIIDEISPRSKDSIIGLGEKLACKLMAAVLRDQGIDAEYVSLEEIVPPSYLLDDASSDPTSKILDQSFYDALSTSIAQRISACSPRVPVITGFFGPVPGSLLAQIGRGYTDLCAALLAAGLGAAELQIWKEVDGIFTADPRKVSTARLISVISPDEAAELTYYGSEVVHPFVMEQAIRKKIPIRMKNVENPTGGGTVIHPDPEAESTHPAYDSPDGIPEPASSVSLSQYALSHHHHTRSPSSPSSQSILPVLASGYAFDDPQNRRLPTAVTIKEHILVLNVHSNRKSVSHGFLAGIFGTLDRYGVVVDLISTSEVHVSMALGCEGLGKRIEERLVGEMRRHGAVSIHRDMAILSLVGKQMRNMVGIAGKMFQTLADSNVNIEMISQGASEINISCVIDKRDAVKALNVIHQSCLMIRPEGPRGRVGPWLF